jgi:hypothetical protein
LSHRDAETDFWDIIVYQASLDTRLKNCATWLVGRNLDLTEWSIEQDYFDLADEIARDYGLNRELYHQALDLASEVVEQGTLYGEA